MNNKLISEAVAAAAIPRPGERRRLRVEVLHASQRSVARLIGVSAQAVYFWELGAKSGGREPRGENLVKYVDLLAEAAALEAGGEGI